MQAFLEAWHNFKAGPHLHIITDRAAYVKAQTSATHSDTQVQMLEHLECRFVVLCLYGRSAQRYNCQQCSQYFLSCCHIFLYKVSSAKVRLSAHKTKEFILFLCFFENNT